MSIRMGDAVVVQVQGHEVTGYVRYIGESGTAEIQLDEPQVFSDLQPGWQQNVPLGRPIQVLHWPREQVRLDPSRPNRSRPVPKNAQRRPHDDRADWDVRPY
jgi:hypothetical protein